MKFRHNKKRNTAFLYESLVRELTKTIINEDLNRKAEVMSLIREFFKKGSLLAKELELYKTLCEAKQLKTRIAEKLIKEAKSQYNQLDKKEIFEQQSHLIKKVNKSLSMSVYDNYVPQYTSLASIYQLFNQDMSPKKKVLLEEKILSKMVDNKILEEQVLTKPYDKIVMKTFVKNFNSEYKENLLSEQKNLLNKYIMSFNNNGLELKIYLNEEISRIKEAIKEYIENNNETEEIKNKTNNLLTVIESFKNKEADTELVTKVLKLQNLIKEITN
jgi:hypothetical protein